MHSESSRRSRTLALRVGAIVLANLLALFVLSRIYTGSRRVEAQPPSVEAPNLEGALTAAARPSEASLAKLAESRIANAASNLATPELAPLAADLAPARDLGALERTIRAEIRATVERASRELRGKVSESNTTVAVHVRQLGAGERAGFGIESDRPMRPASNLKLVTTAAALALLGPDWKFETPAEASGPIVDGTLNGDLVLRASGDPLYTRGANGRVDDLFAPFVAELARRGLREVRGDLVLDERSFPEAAPGPSWPPSNQYWEEYCALAAGFTVDRGCITVSVTPGAVGGRANVAIEPRGLDLAEQVDVSTIAKGPLNVRLGARDGRLLVAGTVPRSAESWTGACSHPDPVALFGAVLRSNLERGGIRIDGKIRRERGAKGGALLGAIVSPLAKYLQAINTDSTNGVADQLFFASALAVRGEASRRAGAATTELALSKLGVSSVGLVQVDGSGLSREDRVSARQMTALVEAVLARDAHASRLYLDSLAVAGESGTLEDRLKNSVARGRVHAKTGFIAGTSALCGVAEARDGARFVFSILIDYPSLDGLNSRYWKGLEDRICELLVGAGS